MKAVLVSGADLPSSPGDDASRKRDRNALFSSQMDSLLAGLRTPTPERKSSLRMSDRPAPAPNTIAVCSGKGGVGKSTVALNLAVSLAAGGAQVGLLDADVHAPDIPLMVGLKRSVPATGWQLSRPGGLERTPLEPVERFGVHLMSSGFIVSEDQALSWNADLIELLLNQLIWSTKWGKLDFLVIDMPPGTSDIFQEVCRLLPDALAVVVVTPQDAAHLDNRRMVTALRSAGIRILGGIENMSGLSCPHCEAAISLYPRVAPDRSIWAGDVSRIGSVPWLATAEAVPIDEPAVLKAADTPYGRALSEAAAAVRAATDGRRDQN